MALQKNLLKGFNIIFPFADFIYILQLEEYDARRYLKWLPRFFFRRGIQRREKLKYTARATLLLTASIAIFLVLLAIDFIHHPLAIALFLFIAATIAIPVIVGFANLLLAPVFFVAHARLRREAANHIARQRGTMKIVAIAGSYGKTTTKGFIEQLCRHQFRIQMPPGNINTPAGIASWIIRELEPSAGLLIIEADGYSRREYLQTCRMAPADIAVITNIGDQHLERFGSWEALRDALAEIFLQSQSAAHLIAPSEVFTQLRRFNFNSRTQHIVDVQKPAHYRGTAIDAPHLSASQQEDVALALTVAEVLEIPERFVRDAARTLQAPERRQLSRELFGYEAIDDSYNISFSTARASIETAKNAAQASHKKLLVITAGIPELAPAEKHKNSELGNMLAAQADYTIVLNSMFASDIVRGLGNTPHTILPTLRTFEQFKKNFSPYEWFLLLLPELNDLYY